MVTHALELEVDAFRIVAVAIVVGKVVADILDIFGRLNFFVALGAGVGLHSLAVCAVAVDAVGSFGRMLEVAHIFLAIILIGALGFAAVAGCAGSEVVRIQEAQALRLGIGFGVADQLIDADRDSRPWWHCMHRLVSMSPLSTVGATGELDLFELKPSVLVQFGMAGRALEAIGGRLRYHDTFLVELRQAGCAVAARARRRDFTFSVPVTEGLFGTGKVPGIDAASSPSCRRAWQVFRSSRQSNHRATR